MTLFVSEHSHDNDEDIVPLVNSKNETTTTNQHENNNHHHDTTTTPRSFCVGNNGIWSHFPRLVVVVGAIIVAITVITVFVYVDDGEDHVGVNEKNHNKPHSYETIVKMTELNGGELDETLDNVSNMTLDDDAIVDLNDNMDQNETKTFSNKSNFQTGDLLVVSHLPLSTHRATVVEAMVRGFTQAKQRFVDRLLFEYGSDNFDKMFVDHHVTGPSIYRGSRLFQPADKGQSGIRFQRKVMIKLLRVLLQFATTTSEEPLSATTFHMIPFVWATGGHSAAAGHGNLYKESYTAVMERSAKDAFAALGLDFIGRNYAMGGTKSSPEIALCTKEIFGVDIDVLSWDFAMTDGNSVEKEVLYCYRAARLQNRPACFSFHTGGSMEKKRWQMTKDLDDLGITSFNSVESIIQAVLNNIPDSFGLSAMELLNMPPFVQHFRCNGQIESGEPFCQDLKYNLTLCPFRKHQTSWHPGWRWHALMGYLMTFFLLDTLESALLAVADASDPEQLLTQLMADEASDYEAFIKKPIPNEYLKKILEPVKTLDDDNNNNFVVSTITKVKKLLEPESFNHDIMEIITQGLNVCHTAKLPAEIRHLGILTESNRTGFITYDQGMNQTDADIVMNPTEFMRLVYNEAERDEDCPIGTTIMDYKDYFYLHHIEQWKTLLLPNNAEWQAYGLDTTKKLHGLIVICYPECTWLICPNGEVNGRENFHAGKFALKVNDVMVTKLIPLQECDILTYANGFLFEPNDDGRFVIQARVLEPNSFLRISSFIIW